MVGELRRPRLCFSKAILGLCFRGLRDFTSWIVSLMDRVGWSSGWWRRCF